MEGSDNLGLRVLQWCCPKGLYEGIEGDLLEQYEVDRQQHGVRLARLRLSWNAIRFIRPGILLRNKIKRKPNQIAMWNNYLKVGWRSIVKNSFYSAINIAGLALGLGFSYLIFLYILGEYRYDRFHTKADRIVRVVHSKTQSTTGNIEGKLSVTAVPLGPKLLSDYGEVERMTRFGSWGSTVKIGENSFSETIVVADPDFFSLFDFNAVEGNGGFLLNRSDVVLSQSAKHKYFGEEAAVGRTISIKVADSTQLFTVTAVVDNHQNEASQHFDVLIPFENLKAVVGEEMFGSLNYGIIETFLLLKNANDRSRLEQKITSQAKDLATKNRELSFSSTYLQPLTDIRLDNSWPTGISRIGNSTYVYVLSGVGILILLMACINFISITAGHTFSRIKEIGVRKVMGAARRQVRNQLMLESLILCLVGVGIGMASIYFVIPLFNSLINSTVEFSLDAASLALVVALVVLIVAVAGGIPGRLLVSVQPVEALKNKFYHGGRGRGVQPFVLIQFTLSLGLIIGTFVVSDQVAYIFEKNLGFDKERLFQVSLQNPVSKEDAFRKVELFKSQKDGYPKLINMTAEMNDYQEPWTALLFEQEVGDPEQIYFNLVDQDYLATMELSLATGRWFDAKQPSSRSRQIVVNEALVKHFRWDDPLSMQIPGKNFEAPHEIIGVVKDFHFSSLHNRIEPLILALDEVAIMDGVTGLSTYRWPPMYNSIAVRIGPGELRPTLEDIEALWSKVGEDAPLDGHFVDQSLDAQYANEKRWMKIINYSSVFAVTIAALGLIGLMRLLLQRKMKEIGIRRALGSSYFNLLQNYSRGFLLMVALAALLSWPLVGWAAGQWLQSFPYRVELSPVPFAVGTLMILAGILSVIAALTWMATRSKPVDVLRNE